MITTNPDKDAYSYCNEKFTTPKYNQACKYDMCNLCCVNINSLGKKKFSFVTVKKFFKDCHKKFPSSKQILE